MYFLPSILGVFTYNVLVKEKDYFNLIIVNTKNRAFTHFDIYPTTLAAMGAKIEGDKLGLGVNLFSKRRTLLEKVGFEKLEENMRTSSTFYNEKILWLDIKYDKEDWE